MATNVFPHSRRKGIIAALDMVEDALASLQEKALQQQLSGEQRNDHAIAPASSDSHSGRSGSAAHKKVPRKETSVLIKRTSRNSSRASRAKHKSRPDKHGGPQKWRDGTNTNNGHRQPEYTTTESLTSLCASEEADRRRPSSRSTRRQNRQHSTSSDTSLDASLWKRKHKLQQQRDRVGEKRPQSQQRGRHGSQEDDGHRSNHHHKERHRSQERNDPQYQQKDGHVSHQQRKTHPPQYERRETHTTQHQHKDAHRPHQAQNTRPSSQQKQGKRTKNNRKGLTGNVADQHFAQTTLATKLREELHKKDHQVEKEEKENFLTYIPCGSKGKSHHIGVVAQQQLGRLKTLPLSHLDLLTPSSSDSSNNIPALPPRHEEPDTSSKVKNRSRSGDNGDRRKGAKRSTSRSETDPRRRNMNDDGSEESDVTEETVRRALGNIHHYLGHISCKTYNV